MKSKDIYSTFIPSSINCIGTVVSQFFDNLSDVCTEIDESILFELKVILNETLINAIRHGNKEDENKLVKLRAGLCEKSIMFIIVEDEGCGYNFANACSCRKPFCEGADPLEVSECGRGIMLLKGLCDNIKVNEKGNKIIIIKSLFRP